MKDNLFVFVVGSISDYSNIDEMIRDILNSEIPPANGQWGETIEHSSKGNSSKIVYYLPENISNNLAYVFAWGLVSEYWGPDDTISQLFTLESWNANLKEMGIE